MKSVIWIASARNDLKEFPVEVRRVMGVAVFDAQNGEKHPAAKPLKGFTGRGVLEIVESHYGNAYRAVYTVRFSGAVYVLHCFQKKSKKGISTPRHEMDLVAARLKIAETHYREHFHKGASR